MPRAQAVVRCSPLLKMEERKEIAFWSSDEVLRCVC